MEFMNDLNEILEVANKSTVKPAEEWMKNVLKLIRVILKAEIAANVPAEATESVETNAKNFKRRFSKLWNFVMKWGMTPGVVRMIVTMLPDQVMQHLERPILMSDFLLESFKISGPLAVLSLRGIFVLMTKYNFEVPDFYTKLYSLFELPVLRSNYRARFFRYSQDFLNSTHLPEYLVAAFVKKLSRMALHAPATVIPLICQFVVNLMINHPGLKVLVHNTSLERAKDLSSDPFEEEEVNPNLTKAMESSLWEMKTLQNHILPSVATACAFIEKPLPNVGFDLEEVISTDYDDMFEEEINKKKNIGHLDAKPFPPFDYEFSGPLKHLADSVHLGNSVAKRIKV
jgi:U3 small nucleolar RNA-associated protein 19